MTPSTVPHGSPTVEAGTATGGRVVVVVVVVVMVVVVVEAAIVAGAAAVEGAEAGPAACTDPGASAAGCTGADGGEEMEGTRAGRPPHEVMTITNPTDAIAHRNRAGNRPPLRLSFLPSEEWIPGRGRITQVRGRRAPGRD